MTDTRPTALAEATLVFEQFSRPPLTSNQRLGWRAKAALTKKVRAAASFQARAAGLRDLGACRVTLVWYVHTRTRRDADNVVPTLKAMCDGLVDAGVVPDDVPRFMDKLMPRIEYEIAGTPRLELHVKQIPVTDAAEGSTRATVYVAGPMSGLPDFNYPAFNEAAQMLRDTGYRVLNPVDSEEENHSGGPETWDWYMRHALRMVTQADGIALLDGADTSRGARLEQQVGKEIGLDIRPLAEWLQ
ncbi:DUF4406 domain-containing protein [Frigoribacterium sp. VKM Ac-2530]|uniref:DUF4406 domain-containing protein n=1 Tax=Frigoribacterium sp. VKM Ac-2530 TaxID=2783822 RepID=UPI00188AD446|nr:DUF4406 domain-containing protein [Frigoribacterium sp. VKM Ac-2530]MBF4578927.1 DUF4406 domain-containing protein [Frigoribacterium sp. VKM Ac-2530]